MQTYLSVLGLGVWILKKGGKSKLLTSLCPQGSSSISCPHWVEDALTVEDLDQGNPPPSSPSAWGGTGRWSWGAPAVQHQEAQHRIGVASLDTRAEVLERTFQG